MDPNPTEGPSSIRRKVDAEADSNTTLTPAEEEEILNKSDDWCVKHLTELEEKIQDAILNLRETEHMRPLAPERITHIVEQLTEKYEFTKLPEILNDLQTNKSESPFYKL